MERMETASRLLSDEEWLALPENGDGREECVNGVIENGPRRVRELLSDYASIGLPEARTVDPTGRSITIYTLERPDYRAAELPWNGVTQPLRFPSVTVDFSAIWP